MIDRNDLMSHAAPLSSLAARALAVAAENEAQASAQATENAAYPAAAVAVPLASAESSATSPAAEGFLAELRASRLAEQRAFLERAQSYQQEVGSKPSALPEFQPLPPVQPLQVTSPAISPAADLPHRFDESERPAPQASVNDWLSQGAAPENLSRFSFAPSRLAPERSTQSLAADFSTGIPDAPATAALPTPMAFHAPVAESVTPVLDAPPVNKSAPLPVAPESAASEIEAVARPAVNFEKNLIFSLGNVRYAVPMGHIIEIAELEHYTPVPNVPEFILGITNLRGDIISLVDLNALQGEVTEEVARGSNLLVTSTAAGDLTTCLVVDRVHGVANVNPEQIQHFDKMSNHGLSSFTRGYVPEGEDLLCLLDLETLLRSLELTH